MDAYACESCGYCYDPAYGDEHHGIAERTLFSRLPRDWVCPECGASKKQFYSLGDDDDEDLDDEDIAYEEEDEEEGWDGDED